MYTIQHFPVSLVLTFGRAALPEAVSHAPRGTRAQLCRSRGWRQKWKILMGHKKLVGEYDKSLLALGYPFKSITGEQHPSILCASSAACTKWA